MSNAASSRLVATELSQRLARARLVAVDRAIAELRRGDPVLIEGVAGTVAALAAEAASPETLAALARLAAQPAGLAVTVHRARAMGIAWSAPDATVLLELPAEIGAETVRALGDPTLGPPPRPLPVARRAGEEAAAAVELSRLAGLLPAALVAMAVPTRAGEALAVPAAAVWQYRELSAAGLAAVAEALVPIDAGTTARVVAFRPADGAVEHLAIVLGEPAADRPVLARLHSQCFTGDLLGSLRCDCGDQLRGAIREIVAAGGGVLVYLAQEGRGIGLVNKLRAYGLQDRGFDTIEANEQLGFHEDERDYREAATMLLKLGFRRVRLMTNNPRKLEALAKHGVEVVERVAHAFPANDHNKRYLWTKANRSGHLF
jgi:GTP cyclohydrolase II